MKKEMIFWVCFGILPFLGCETNPIVVEPFAFDRFPYSDLQERPSPPSIHEGNWAHLQQMLCYDKTSPDCLHFQEFLQADVPLVQDGEFFTVGDLIVFDINHDQVEKLQTQSISLHIRKQPNQKAEFRFAHGNAVPPSEELAKLPISTTNLSALSSFQTSALQLLEQKKPLWTAVQVCDRSVCTAEDTKPSIYPAFQMDVVMRQKEKTLFLLVFLTSQEKQPQIKVWFSSMPWLTPQIEKPKEEKLPIPPKGQKSRTQKKASPQKQTRKK